MNDDAIRIRAIKRCAAVTMDLERMDDRDALSHELPLQFAHSLDTLDDEAQMIERSLLT